MPALVYRAGALGDCLVSLPAIELYRRCAAKRGRMLSIATRGDVGRLLKSCNYPAAMLDCESAQMVALFAELPGSDPFLARFQEALVFAEGASIAAQLQANGLRPALQAPGRPPGDARRRTDLFYVDHLVAAEGGEIADSADVAASHGLILDPFATAAELRSQWQNLHHNRLLIHAGAGSVTKHPPTEWLVAAAERAHRIGAGITLVNGPADSAATGTLRGLFEERGISGIEVVAPDIVTLARLLCSAGGIVCGDSGVAHLAAAVGATLFALFVSSSIELWHPRGQETRVFDTRKEDGLARFLSAIEATVRR